MSSDTKALIAKLDKPCRRALEEAAELCVSQTHFNVELEHFLARLLAQPETDIALILRQYDVDPALLEAQLAEFLANAKRGNSRTPALAPQILDAIEGAWLVSSVQLASPVVRSGALLLAMLERDALRGALTDSCPAILRVPRDRLRQDLPALAKASAEAAAAVPGAAKGAGQTVQPGMPARPGEPGALGQFTVDLTANARAGRIDPILGRDSEIRQVIDILMRRRQNNPILTGEAGVGKTAVAEGLALRIAAGDVPPPLKDVSIRMLDLGLLQAGAGVKGEFEQRLKSVIGEVAASPTPIILFIDEAHTLIGSGGAAGQGDAANLLKPALARGELRTIAATTWAEYKKYFEKDPALARRFQVVKVAEPDEPTAEIMLRGLASRLEGHHKVRILDEAVAAAVRLSHRYITGRQLPDKAIGVLDTACARVAVAQAATPAPVEAAERRADAIGREIAALEREAKAGGGDPGRLARLTEERETVAAEQRRLAARWAEERALAEEVLASLKAVEASPGGNRLAVLTEQRARLAALQGETPMVPVFVDAAVVAEVIAGWTGIPVGRMMQDEMTGMLSLEARMAERLVGQPQALATIARRVRTYHADLGEPGKPVGVFLLAGPSGVGKTETAVTLADLLYGGERSLIVINMSEFQEAHAVALLKGAPPGYVGHGTGGVLTEAVRRQPYSVVLLDEIEKAHPDVMDLFYQVFDKGQMEDAEGVEIDFRNTLFLLTSNLGTAELTALGAGGRRPDAEEAVAAVRPALLTRLKPALLARMVVVPYYPLDDAMLRRIVDLKLDRLRRRMRERHGAELDLAADLPSVIAARCTEVDSGARNVDQILTNSLLPLLSEGIIARMAEGRPFSRVTVGYDGSGFTCAFDTDVDSGQ